MADLLANLFKYFMDNSLCYINNHITHYPIFLNGSETTPGLTLTTHITGLKKNSSRIVNVKAKVGVFDTCTLIKYPVNIEFLVTVFSKTTSRLQMYVIFGDFDTVSHTKSCEMLLVQHL